MILNDFNMTENKLSFEEFERLLINTCNNNYINYPYHNKDILSINDDITITINDYIQIYKFMMKIKDKNKIQNLEKEIEDLKIYNNILIILCGIILSILSIKII